MDLICFACIVLCIALRERHESSTKGVAAVKYYMLALRANKQITQITRVSRIRKVFNICVGDPLPHEEKEDVCG